MLKTDYLSVVLRRTLSRMAADLNSLDKSISSIEAEEAALCQTHHRYKAHLSIPGVAQLSLLVLSAK